MRSRLTRRAFTARSATLACGIASIPPVHTFAVSTAQLTAAVIGHTDRGGYGHGMERLWQDVDRAKLVAVADAHPAGLAKMSQRLGVAGFANYREMLERVKPQLVAVGPRWLDQHRDMVVACAEAGVKGIYLEKPMCRELREADAMVEACQRHGTKLAMATQNRYCPQVQTISEMIADDTLGDIVEIRARGKDDRRGGGEDLWVLGTHMLDLMGLFGGDAQTCYAEVRESGELVTKKHVKPGNEGIGPLAGDEVHAMYRLAHGITGYWDSKRNMFGKPTRFGIRVQGTKGVVELYDTGSSPFACYLPASSWSTGRAQTQWKTIASTGIGNKETATNSLHAGNVLAVNDLIDCLQSDRQPKANIYAARKTVEMIAAVFESHRLKRAVAIPLNNRTNPLTMLS